MGSWAAADEPRAPRRKNKVIEYTKLRRATAGTTTIGRIRMNTRAIAAARPTTTMSAKDDVPNARGARTPRAIPPPNAQTRQLSRPIAIVQTTAKTKTRCGWALPTRMYGPTVSSTIAVTVAPIAATNGDMADDPRQAGQGRARRCSWRDVRGVGDVAVEYPTRLRFGQRFAASAAPRARAARIVSRGTFRASRSHGEVADKGDLRPSSHRGRPFEW